MVNASPSLYCISHCLSLLQRWEQLVVSKLKWELSAVTPGDFLMHILSRLSMPRTWDTVMVRRHAQTFIALSARGENRLMCYRKNSITGKCQGITTIPLLLLFMKKISITRLPILRSHIRIRRVAFGFLEYRDRHKCF